MRTYQEAREEERQSRVAGWQGGETSERDRRDGDRGKSEIGREKERSGGIRGIASTLAVPQWYRAATPPFTRSPTTPSAVPVTPLVRTTALPPFHLPRERYSALGASALARTPRILFPTFFPSVANSILHLVLLLLYPAPHLHSLPCLSRW